jgi:hypothetical protein
MPKTKTFAEVEELACLVYQATLEFGGSEEQAKQRAQAVWAANPDV